MDVEFGNAGDVDTEGTGWFIGFSEWTKRGDGGAAGLRHMPADALARTVAVKWMAHPVGDDRGAAKPPSDGRSVAILVSESGSFAFEFATDALFSPGHTVTHALSRHGDFVIWGEGLYHRWIVEQPCTILTIRWVPTTSLAVPPDEL